MRLFRIVLIIFGMLMVAGILLFQFNKRGNAITACIREKEREDLLPPDREEEMRREELTPPEHGAEEVLPQTKSSIETEVSPVLRQLNRLSFAHAFESLDSLTNGAMKNILRHNLELAERAKEELRKLEKDIQQGKIQRNLVHGRWLVVTLVDREMKCVHYHSEEGPIWTYTKHMYAKSNRENELHKLGYVLDFHRDGRIKSCFRRNLQEMLEYHQDGRLKDFCVEEWIEGRYTGRQYMASWNMDGELLREGTSKGLIEKRGSSLKKSVKSDGKN